jgi:hypothetical protein
MRTCGIILFRNPVFSILIWKPGFRETHQVPEVLPSDAEMLPPAANVSVRLLSVRSTWRRLITGSLYGEP